MKERYEDYIVNEIFKEVIMVRNYVNPNLHKIKLPYVKNDILIKRYKFLRGKEPAGLSFGDYIFSKYGIHHKDRDKVFQKIHTKILDLIDNYE